MYRAKQCYALRKKKLEHKMRKKQNHHRQTRKMKRKKIILKNSTEMKFDKMS